MIRGSRTALRAISRGARRPAAYHTTAAACSSTSASDVVVIGASVIDLVAYCPHMPAVGETVLGTDFQSGFGGKGANQAVAAARCGASVSMISKVGDDLFGHDTIKNFKDNNVDCDHVAVVGDRPTGCAPIMVDAAGDNAICVVMAANNELTAADAEAARELLGNARVVVGQLEVPSAATLAALRVAKEEGGDACLTVLNTAPAPGDVAAMDPPFSEYLGAADVVCPNEPEAEALTGLPVGDGDIGDARAAAQALFEQSASATSPAHVVLTLGKRGALWVERGGDPDGTFVEGTPDVAVDTVGAGDAFVGTFAALVAGGASFVEAIEGGNKYAGKSVTRAGTQSSYPTPDELPW